jgi:glutathione S-transferase
MSAELVFYTNPMSRGRIVRWMLEEVGQPYRTELLDFATTAKSPEFLAINPMGKVPTLTHGDEVETEAAAICLYLDDAFHQAGLAPAPGDPRRGTYYRWTLFAAGPIEQVITNTSMGWIAPEERRGMVGYGSFEDAVNAAETAVKPGPFILGDQFSAADVYFGSSLGWGMQFGAIEKRPAFEAYVERINNRPAAIRAREIDDGLIAAAQAKQSEPA